MSPRSAIVMLAATAALAVRPAGAQRADAAPAGVTDTSRGALSCPREGTMVRLWAGAAADSAGRAGRTPRDESRRAVIDTVVTLSITDRTWQRDSVSAGVSLGVAGTAGARRAPWHACAGATATLRRITATLHNVHGQIHLRADPAALDAIGRTAGTPPPAPPRR